MAYTPPPPEEVSQVEETLREMMRLMDLDVVGQVSPAVHAEVSDECCAARGKVDRVQQRGKPDVHGVERSVVSKGNAREVVVRVSNTGGNARRFVEGDQLREHDRFESEQRVENAGLGVPGEAGAFLTVCPARVMVTLASTVEPSAESIVRSTSSPMFDPETA